jgi:hypothetical protein
MKRPSRILSIVGSLFSIMLATSALAVIDSPLPFLPPGGTYYVNPPTQPITFTSTQLTNAGITSITLENLRHTPGPIFDQGYTESGGVSNYWDKFASTLTGDALVRFMGGGSILGSLFATGSVGVTVGAFTNGNTGGPFNTSMDFLNWPAATVSWDSTNMSIFITCQPGAKGAVTVATLVNGMYRIDSYFDVWPEISFDDSHWIPSDSSVTMTIVPEPCSFMLLALGAVALAVRVRRGRR